MNSCKIWATFVLCVFGFQHAFGNVCSRTFNESRGRITHPGYPNSYADNLNCLYKIAGDVQSKLITVSLSSLHLETCDNCNCDWLSINNGPKLCHSTTFTKTYNFTDSFPVQFRTDGSKTGNGFMIDYTIVDSQCTDGRFGGMCDRECHCKGRPCDADSGLCHHGCQLGWKGPFCDTEKMKATAKFYCFNIDDTYSMIFRVNQRDTIYRSVSAIDAQGNEVTNCGKTVFDHFEEGGMATLNVTQFNGRYRPRCGESKENDDTVIWRFKFHEFLLTSSAYDILFEVKCDFSTADSLERTTLSNSEKPPNTTTSLTESKLSISFDVIDPFHETSVTTAKLGQHVILQAKLNNIEDFGISAIAPFNCSVSTLDDEYTVKFSDENGCSPEGAQIYFLNTNLTRWRSELFEAFTFSGHDKISFRCRFHVCFTERSHYCRDMCTHSKKRKGTKHRKRRKGRTSRQPPEVGTTLSIDTSVTDSPSDGHFMLN